MKIGALKLEHFRRFDAFSIGFHPQLTVLVAPNGAGKTAILDALAVSLGAYLTRLPDVAGYNFKESDFQVYEDGKKPPYMRVTCESVAGIKWDRTERRDKTKRTLAEIPPAVGLASLNKHVDRLIDQSNGEAQFELPVFIYYGTGRGVFDIPQRKRGFGKEFPRFDALKGALDSRTNFRSLVEYLYALEVIELREQRARHRFEYQIPELRAVREAVKKVLPGFSNPQSARPAGIAVDWKHGKKKTTTLRIEQLSDGYRTTLAMAMDIAVRMAEANPQAKKPLQTEGVVLIDEVDLHLHPGWQQTILLDLMIAFPNIQFIVSTHSPQVISSVKPECLRVIDWQCSAPRAVAFSEGAEAQQMLLDVLGLESARVTRLPIIKQLKRYESLVAEGMWDTPEATKILQELKAWGSEHEPELARLDLDVRIKQWERDNEESA